MKLTASSGAKTPMVVASEARLTVPGASAVSSRTPGTDASSGTRFYEPPARRRTSTSGDDARALPGRQFAASPHRRLPTRRAGDPAQRWPAGTWPLMTAPGLDLALRSDRRARHQHGTGSEAGVVANPQLAHNQLVPVDPPAVEIDVWLERGRDSPTATRLVGGGIVPNRVPSPIR